jgi:pimeloyl-ACP methyl ester carboxylesterase
MQLNYKTYGQGEPLIILHGLFGSLDNWHTLARKLGEHYQVFIVDQRNHGKSPHTSAMNYPAMAADIASFMDDRGLEQTFLAGHSMGGKTAMELALTEPDRVKKLVSIDMTPFSLSGGHQKLFEAMNALNLPDINKRKEADEALKPFVEDFGIRQFLLKNLERAEEGGYRWKMNLPVIEANYDNLMKGVDEGSRSFERPTLFVKGERSDYLNPAQLESYQALFTRAQLKTIAGVGHWVHAEAPQAFQEVLEAFLKD